MSWVVEWAKSPHLLSSGRNGTAYQTGISVLSVDYPDASCRRLVLRPINSTGCVTCGCSLDLPLEKLGELLTILQDLAPGQAGGEGAAASQEHSPAEFFKGASHWEDHPEFPVEDWRLEVENGDTRLSYVKRGAPSNTAGNRSGVGRTKEEASMAAAHWNNQAPWEGFKRVHVFDEDHRTHPQHSPSAGIAWVLMGWLDDAPPLHGRWKETMRLFDAGLYAQAVAAYFEAMDAKGPLTGG